MSLGSPSLSSIEKHYKEHESDWADEFRLRIHRAISWLRAAQQSDDLDTQFILLWVSFNSAYARELSDDANGASEQRRFTQYFNNIIDCGGKDVLYNIIWEKFPGAIRMLIDNQYVYKQFWDHKRGIASDWKKSFKKEKSAAKRALSQKRVDKILRIIFARLYVLRNQLMHGGATWSGSANRKQVRDGVSILQEIVPRIIHVMMQAPEQDWGPVSFPYIPDRDD